MNDYLSMPKPERNAELVRLHVDERMTLTDIGIRCGISSERVRQLVRRAGVSLSVTAEVRAEKYATCWVEEVCEGCGNRRLVQPSEVRRFCSRSCWSKNGSKWTDTRLLDDLRRLALILNKTPGMKHLKKPWPAHTLYYRRFGSLTRAQEMAGLNPNSSGACGHNTPLPDGFRKQWSHLLETTA